jgi:hypothetical protein
MEISGKPGTYSEEYDQFIDRIRSNSLAVKVKITDPKNNSNLERISESKNNDYMY